MPVARGIEQVRGYGDEIGDGVCNRSDLSKRGFLEMLELSGKLRDVGVHTHEGLNLVGNLGALISDHHEVGRGVLSRPGLHGPDKRPDGDEGDQPFFHGNAP